MKKYSTSRTGLYIMTIVLMGAVFALAPLGSAAAATSQPQSVAVMLLGKPAERMLDAVRNRPSNQAVVAGAFGKRDHYRRGASALLEGDDNTSMFFDMRHETDLENETWFGSAGLQIVW